MKTSMAYIGSLPILSFHLEQYSFYFYLISKAVNHYVEARHAVFLVTVLADTATLATTSVIIGMDFLLNIYHGLKIVYFIKKKKASPSDDNCKFKIIYCLGSHIFRILTLSLPPVY